jgi:hypothetical protein
MKRLSIVACALALAACERVKVSVSCVTVAGPAVECTVQEVQGKGKAETCWDFTVNCQNGKKVHMERTCQTVTDGKTEKLTVPGSKLTGVADCDKASGAEVTNMTINGDKAE